MSVAATRALMAGSCLLLMLAPCIVLVIGATQRDKQLDLRLAELSLLQLQNRKMRERDGLSLTTSKPVAGFARLLLRLFGYDPAQRHRHPVGFQVIFPVALAAGYLAGFVLSHVVGRVAWLTVLPASVFVGRSFYQACNNRVEQALFKQFPDALGMIVRAVRVGVPVSEAIRLVSVENPQPTAGEFGKASEQVAIGLTMDDALREMAVRNSLPEYRFFATALSLQSQTGGGLSEILDNLADTIRKRAAARERGHALASEAKMSMYVLAGLPPVAGAIIGFINPVYISVLFEKTAGQHILAAACVLWCVGMFSMRTLIRKSLS
ncbi:MAG: type II secretion system F family protein [Janthinobacterium lividum]